MASTTVIVITPLKDKIISWFLIALHYGFIFVTPMIAAYFYLAKDTLDKAGKGGLLYFLIVGLAGGGLAIALLKLINKQKANGFKTIFRMGIKIGLMFGILNMVKYINVNLAALDKVLWITLGGFIVGSIIEFIAVSKYRDYIREVGVF